MANSGRKGNMTVAKGSNQVSFLAYVVCALFLLVAQVSPAAETVHFENGISATIHGFEEIDSDLVPNKDGSRELIHPAAGSLALLGSNSGWVPYVAQDVLDALAAMHGFETRLDVEIFLLPAPPVDIASSFARRGAIFLSPGTGPIPAATTAYITTHEMGHVMTWAFLDDYSSRWDAYLELRDLDDSNLSSDALHADRAREIIAEDIRFLFGGAAATSSGTIENHDLINPDRVDGLSELLSGFFQGNLVEVQAVLARAYPNPCNPLTTIEMSVDSNDLSVGDSATLRIYDIRGSLIRTVSGGHAANGVVAIQWNGTDGSGGTAASGRYLYVIQAGASVAKGSVTLVR
jgi:FlgD Ig-like domain